MSKICNHPGCKNPVFGGGLCSRHQYIRLDKNLKKIKINAPIKKISTRLRNLAKKYSQLREEFLKNHPLCEAHLHDCTRIATDIHHKRGRGKYLLDITTWLSVCRRCHQWIETRPKQAKELGLSDTRLT